jgi:hypothetical protein
VKKKENQVHKKYSQFSIQRTIHQNLKKSRKIVDMKKFLPYGQSQQPTQ